MEQVAELQIPARLEFVALARLVVSSLASTDEKLSDPKIDDLKLAISEACTNAIEAHASAGVDIPVSIKCRETAHALEVTVTDQGRGFDPATLSTHPSVTDPERLNFERGLGVPLIRSLVDEVEFVSSDQGTAVRMTLLSQGAGDQKAS